MIEFASANLSSDFANLVAIQRTKPAHPKPTFIHLDLWMAGVTGFGTKRSLPNETRNVSLCQNPTSLRYDAAENYPVGAKLAQALFNSDALTAPPRDHIVELTVGEGQTRERRADNETGPDRYRTKSRIGSDRDMPEMGDLLRKGSVTDPFFEVLNDGDWNACIGMQGDEINYVEGYLQAAQLLVDTLLEKEMFGSRDTLAMPILFNARHGLELALKYVLRELGALGMARTREGPVDHDLHAYWVHLSEQRIGDRACREQLAELKPFVESFMKQDIDGQELRYFENRDGKQSLGEQAVVNLRLIQAAVRELRDILDRMMESVARLAQEDVAGTRTAECSRSDLIAIARIVGPKPSWTEDAFLEHKADAMAQFGLSSKSFSKALEAVKASRELKNLIEIESDLLHLSEAKIVEIVALWLDANPPKPANTPPRMVNPASISFDDIMRYGDKMGALNRAVMKQLTVEEFADLQTIFYVGRDRRFGEEYPRLLETTLAAHRLAKERYALFHHILSKKNFIDGLAAGLRRVGQPALGDKVAHMRDALRPAE